MNEYRTNNNEAVVTVTPLFASSWMALYYVLRENFHARRTPGGLPKQVSLINDDTTDNITTD
jgi:hypothetical protein